MKITVHPPVPFASGSTIDRHGVALSADGSRLATVHGTVSLFDISDPTAPKTLLASASPGLGYPAFSPDDVLFCGPHRLDADGQTFKQVFEPEGTTGEFWQELHWMPDGRIVLSSGWVQVSVHSPAADRYTTDVVSEQKDPGRDARMAVAPDGSAAAVGGHEWVFVYDLKTGKYLKRLPKRKVYSATCPVWCDAGLLYVDDHPDSLPLPGREISRVTLAQRTGKKKFADLRHFDAPNLKVTGLLLRGDALVGLYSGEPDTLIVWDIQTGERRHEAPIKNLGTVSDYAMSADHRRIAVAGFDAVTLIDLEDT